MSIIQCHLVRAHVYVTSLFFPWGLGTGWGGEADGRGSGGEGRGCVGRGRGGISAILVDSGIM